MAETARRRQPRLRHLGDTVRVRTTAAAVAVVGVALLSASIALVAILADSLTQSAEEHASSRAAEVAAILADSTGTLGLIGTREDDEVVQVVDGRGTVIDRKSTRLNSSHG